MSTIDRRHCLICGTWWALESEDTPRECPTCQERGANVLACPQPDCEDARGHDDGAHELTAIRVRLIPTAATERDLERADELIEFATVTDVNVDTLRHLIAQALADERARSAGLPGDDRGGQGR